MDYFGVVDGEKDLERNEKLKEKILESNKETPTFNLDPNAFQCYQPFNFPSSQKCNTIGCNNPVACYGDIYLPYCDQELTCAKNNIRHLSFQNAKQNGEIKGYQKSLQYISNSHYETDKASRFQPFNAFAK